MLFAVVGLSVMCRPALLSSLPNASGRVTLSEVLLWGVQVLALAFCLVPLVDLFDLVRPARLEVPPASGYVTWLDLPDWQSHQHQDM